MITRIFTPLWNALKWAKLAAWKVVNALWKSETTKQIDDLSKIFKQHLIQPEAHAGWFEHYHDWRFREYWYERETGVVDVWTAIYWVWINILQPILGYIIGWLSVFYKWIKDFYESVIKKIIEWYDKTIGKVVDYWYKVKAFVGTVADIIGIFKPEWKRWIEDKLDWIQNKLIAPIEKAFAELKEKVAEVYRLLTDPLDKILSKLKWLRDFKKIYIDPLKELIVPTIEAPNLLGKEACVKTTIIYGEEVANALDGSAWVRPDPPTVVKMERAEGYDVIDYFASEMMLVETGKFAFALDFGTKFAKEVLKLEIIKTAALTAGTLDFLFPGRKTGEKKVQELMKD